MYSTSASTIAGYTSSTIWLNVYLEIGNRYCWRMYESSVAQNCNVTASLFWTGIAVRNLVSLFTIYGPTKFISSSKPVGAIGGNLLYCPLYSWNFKSAHKLVPLYTYLFLYNSVCHQCLSRRFLLLDNMWCTNMKAALSACEDDIFPPGAANTGGSQRTALSPEWAPSFPKLNLRASRTSLSYVTLLQCGRMFKSVCALSRTFAVARLLGLRVRIPDVCLCDCYMLSVDVSASGWSLVQRSPTECSVTECDREASIWKRLWPTRGCCPMERRLW